MNVITYLETIRNLQRRLISKERCNNCEEEQEILRDFVECHSNAISEYAKANGHPSSREDSCRKKYKFSFVFDVNAI